jgi:ATP-dependent DNA helicase DinG
LNALLAACNRAASALSTVSEIAPEFIRLHERVTEFAARIESFANPVGDEVVRWLDVGTQLKLVQSPLDIADALKQKLLDPMAAVGSRKSLVFTSATLGQDAKLSWFTERCGLSSAEILKVASPFDYAIQASLYIPSVFSKPNDQEHSLQVAALVAKAASVIGGRTMVLTTTLRALQAVSEALQSYFKDAMTLDILVQGHHTKRELLDRFRQGGQNGQAGCILVASASFWEGVDVPGESLQLVVIDKLPFPPPGDPVVEARSKMLEAKGRSVFNSYFMPEATIALRQGAGRLIRRESDRGVLVVCDTRLGAMGYGKRLLASLPPMKKISSETELMDAMEQLTRSSTKDPRCP